MPAQYGIIGYPLAHSFSAAYFKKKFVDLGIDATYEPFALPDFAAFPALLAANPLLEGLNVTIPHKQNIIPYLDELDAIARGTGAVNCVTIRNGYKKGYNTDVAGFEHSLRPLLQPHHTHALILGTGGASKAVAWVLEQLGISYQKVSRTAQDGCITYASLSEEIIAGCLLIVNTAPLGQYPVMDTAAPIPYGGITGRHLLYDLVYNPAETKFLSLGKAQGATIKNGFEMLQLQAEEGWRIWTEQKRLF